MKTLTFGGDLLLTLLLHVGASASICAWLARSATFRKVLFTELRDSLDMTDGNLTTHIRTLQGAGYVSVAKSYQNRRPLTTCSLTAKGRKAFATYINLLEEIVRQTKPNK